MSLHCLVYLQDHPLCTCCKIHKKNIWLQQDALVHQIIDDNRDTKLLGYNFGIQLALELVQFQYPDFAKTIPYSPSKLGRLGKRSVLLGKELYSRFYESSDHTEVCGTVSLTCEYLPCISGSLSLTFSPHTCAGSSVSVVGTCRIFRNGKIYHFHQPGKYRILHNGTASCLDHQTVYIS